MHPNDVVAALQWAVKQASKGGSSPYELMVYGTLCELLTDARKAALATEVAA